MKIGTFITASLITLLLTATISFAKELEVDPNHSSILFEAKHLKISKIPGRFTEFTGAIDLDERDFSKTKVDFTVEIPSVNTAVKMRDDHLKTADFFDATKFPKATFRSTSISKAGAEWAMKGDLTIRDVTKPVEFKVKNAGVVQDPMMKTDKNVFQATGTINRKDYGVSYGADALVSDNIDLTINLETVPAKK